MARYSDEFGIADFIYRHRLGLMPFYVAVPVGVIGTVARLYLDGFLTLLLLGCITLAVGAWSTTRVADPMRRWYHFISLGAANAWVLALKFAWFSPLTAAVVWLSGTLVLGIPWWASSAKRTQVQMEDNLRHWPVASERINLGKARIGSMKRTGAGRNWTALMTWDPGQYRFEDIKNRKEEIEGALGLDYGTLRIERPGKSTNSARLSAFIDDPLAQSVPWEIPVRELAGELVVRLLKASDPIRFALREDKQWKTVRMFADGWGASQALIAGMKGSGKSGLLNILWATWACCEDVVQWGIDLKGGMELGPWRGVFDWVVTDRAAAVRMMAAAEKIIDARSAYCAERGWKTWKASPDHPVLAISVDEAASLLGDANSRELHYVEEIARKGRAVGVIVVLATQFPTLDALGSNQIRQQIDQRFAFRMADGDGEHYVVPGHKVDAHKLPHNRPGTLYYLNGEELESMPLRTLEVLDNVIKQVVELRTGYTVGLDAPSTAIAMEVKEYAERELASPVSTGTLPLDPETGTPVEVPAETETETGTPVENNSTENIPTWNDGPDVSLSLIMEKREAGLSPEQREAERESRETRKREAEKAERERLGETEALAALKAALRAAGSEGTAPRKLAEAATRSMSWTHGKLNELSDAGEAKRTGHGTWVAVTESVS